MCILAHRLSSQLNLADDNSGLANNDCIFLPRHRAMAVCVQSEKRTMFSSCGYCFPLRATLLHSENKLILILLCCITRASTAAVAVLAIFFLLPPLSRLLLLLFLPPLTTFYHPPFLVVALAFRHRARG